MNKLTYLLGVLFVLLLCTSETTAQTLTEDQRCGTEKSHQELIQKYPGQVQSHQEFEDWIAKEIKKRQSKNTISAKGNPLLNIPIIFHIIHSGQPVGSGPNIAKAYVDAQLQQLNNDFRKIVGTSGDNNHPAGADSEIEFCAAAQDPNGNVLTEFGINRINAPATGIGNPPFSSNAMDNTVKPATIWDPDRYFNVWVSDLGGGLLGYAQFPSSSGLPGMPGNGGPANTDGVVVLYSSVGSSTLPYPGGFPYDEGRTLTHEAGHFFGLRHIWGDSNCGNDFCADTPQSSGANFGCPNKTSCDGIVDMVQNYMDYSNDACMNIFTVDQKARMQTVMAASPRRASLASSTACSTTPAPPTANFFSDNTVSCTVPFTVQFQDLSGGFPSVATWNWSFPGGTPAASTMQNPIVTYNASGTYDVTLIVTNSVGGDTIQKTGYITVNTVPIGIPSPVLEDFQTVTFPPAGWAIDNPDGSVTWERTTSAGYNSTASMYMDYWDYPSNGPIDDMKLPGIDCGNLTNTELTFDLAYALFSGIGGGYSDTLEILVSIDCGATYTSVYKKFEAGLVTAPNHTIEFFPTPNEWRQEVVNLSAYDGQANLEIVFRGISDYENNLFIDNINIAGTAPAAPPVAGFNFTSTSGCQSEVVQFTDNSVNGPTSWNWTFTGGTPATSTMQNPVVTYNTPGTYNATLIATNTLGADTLTQMAIVTVSPAMVTSLTTTDLLCNGDADGSASVTANGANPILYNWSNGGTTAMINNINGGTYMVSVTDANNCMNVETAIINEPTAISINGTTTSSNCGANNGSVSLTVTGGTGAYSYLWSSGQTTPSIMGLTSGTYAVSVTDANNCTETSTFTITGMAITVTSIDETCANTNNGSATAISNNGTGPFVYLWSDGQSTATASGLAPGTYTIVITDTNGCVGTESVTIAAGQVATLSTTTTNVSCGLVDDGTAVANLNGGVQPITYVWSNGAVSQGVAGLNVGTYMVTATDAVGCSATGSVTIMDANINADVMPSQVVINLAVNPTVNFTDNTIGATSWMWDFGDGTTSTVQNPSHTYTAVGTYTVTVTVSNGQCSDTQTIIILVNDTSTGLEDWEGMTSFEVFPNPTTGQFTLALNVAESTDLVVRVLNPLGQAVITDRLEGVSAAVNTEYDLSRFTSGVYFVQVTDGARVVAKKLFYLK